MKAYIYSITVSPDMLSSIHGFKSTVKEIRIPNIIKNKEESFDLFINNQAVFLSNNENSLSRQSISENIKKLTMSAEQWKMAAKLAKALLTKTTVFNELKKELFGNKDNKDPMKP